MVESVRIGLAYGVVKAPVTTQPPNSWKKLTVILESLRPTHKELGMPEGAVFEAIHIRAGVVGVRIDSGKHGPAIAEKITALEEQGANFIIRASVPTFSNEDAAGCLNDVMNILCGRLSAETSAMGVFHLDAAGLPVCSFAAPQ